MGRRRNNSLYHMISPVRKKHEKQPPSGHASPAMQGKENTAYEEELKPTDYLRTHTFGRRSPDVSSRHPCTGRCRSLGRS